MKINVIFFLFTMVSMGILGADDSQQAIPCQGKVVAVYKEGLEIDGTVWVSSPTGSGVCNESTFIVTDYPGHAAVDDRLSITVTPSGVLDKQTQLDGTEIVNTPERAYKFVAKVEPNGTTPGVVTNP